jgi:hypothetical protein
MLEAISLIRPETVLVKPPSFIYMYVFIVITIILQSICMAYIIKLTNVARGLDILDVNTTEVRIFKNKIESIIDFICSTENICN